MKKTWIGLGIAAGVAAILVYPSILLFRRLSRKRAVKEEIEPEHIVKAFVPAYRGKRLPHHRHPRQN